MTQSDSYSVIKPHLSRLLNSRDSPKTICPSEVARALSSAELKSLNASDWRELMPAVREELWAMRDRGEVEILRKGNVLPRDAALEDVKGPIRARRALDE